MTTETLQLKRALREALYQRQGKSVLDLDPAKTPDAFIQGVDLAARHQAALARVTSGVRQLGTPYPNGYQPSAQEDQKAQASYWVAVDGAIIAHQTGSPFEQVLTPENVDDARARHEEYEVGRLLQDELVEEYLDFVTGIS